MDFMNSMVKGLEALTDSAIVATKHGVEGVAQGFTTVGRETVEGISMLASSAIAVPVAALDTVGEATLSLITNNGHTREKRPYYPFKPNIMRCACVGDSDVGKSTLLATWREGRSPTDRHPPTVYEWFYFSYCLNSKSLIRALDQQIQQADDKPETDLDTTQKADIQEVVDQLEQNLKLEKRQEKKNERKQITIEFLDTAGEYEGYRHLRPWHYKDVDVFLVAFDITNRESFLNVERHWIEDVKTWNPACVMILVGTKADLDIKKMHEADDPVDTSSSMHRSSSAPTLASSTSSLFSSITSTLTSSPLIRSRQPSKASEAKQARQVTKEEAEELANRINAVTYLEVSSMTQLNLECLLQLCVSQVFLLEDSPPSDAGTSQVA